MADTGIPSPYADFNYYSKVYGGSKISEDAFPWFEKRAEAVLHRITFNRIKKRPEIVDDGELESIRMAVCAMVDSDFQESKKTPGVMSESIDGYSVSYSDKGGSSGNAGRTTEMLNAAMSYLHSTGLLYKGRSRKYDYECRHNNL